MLNVSIDLGVHGRDASPRPPVEAYLRVIEQPLLRLVSVDLGASADITNLAEVFDFAKDYLGLLKAAVIASGIVPPGIEGSGQSLADLLSRMLGPGRGLEIVSSVNNIPKGSRLAVSTTLLAALVSVCMRATGQAASLTGQLQEHERRLVLARALLGEWLGGIGRRVAGLGRRVARHEADRRRAGRGRGPRTRRQPRQADAAAPHLHREGCLTRDPAQAAGEPGAGSWRYGSERRADPGDGDREIPASLRGRMEGAPEHAGHPAEILSALQRGDVRAIGAATTRNFGQPLQAIIPWATNYFTEALIGQVRAEFGDAFWGFWMLGGMSGGGMGFIFAPEKKTLAQKRLQELMSATKRELQHALPFAMEPVVYDFAINERGTYADLLQGAEALMPSGYYTLTVPALLRQDRHSLSLLVRAELDKFGAACRTKPELRGVVQTLFDVMLPRGKSESASEQTLSTLLKEHGFDPVQHEQIRADLKEGRIGLAQNRLPASAVIEDVKDEDVIDARAWLSSASLRLANVPASFQLAGAGADATCKLAALPFTAFDKHRPAAIHSRNLPHWRQEGVTYFITFRLGTLCQPQLCRMRSASATSFCAAIRTPSPPSAAKS